MSRVRLARRPPSRRQKLNRFANAGKLRSALERGRLDPDAIDLCVDVILRYCEPRRTRVRRVAS